MTSALLLPLIPWSCWRSTSIMCEDKLFCPIDTWYNLSNFDDPVNHAVRGIVFFLQQYLSHQTWFFTIKQHLRTEFHIFNLHCMKIPTLTVILVNLVLYMFTTINCYRRRFNGFRKLCHFLLQIYESAYHQVHNESEGYGEKCRHQVADWILKRCWYILIKLVLGWIA